MEDILFLTEEEVIAVHDDQVRLFGGDPGIFNPDLLSSAIAQPLQAFNYIPECTVFEVAATYAYGLARNHAFNDANKRTAAAATIVFLDLNGWSVEREFDDAILAIVEGKMTKAEFANLLSNICVEKPDDR